MRRLVVGMAGSGHVLVIDQLDSDLRHRLIHDLSKVGVQLALAARRGHPAVHLGLCSASGGHDGNPVQVQVALERPAGHEYFLCSQRTSILQTQAAGLMLIGSAASFHTVESF